VAVLQWRSHCREMVVPSLGAGFEGGGGGGFPMVGRTGSTGMFIVQEAEEEM
jgi:hypothetical protein